MFFRRKRNAVVAEVRSILGEDQILAIDESANFFGLESAGSGQIRGNGCLAAGPDELLFIMWMPRREIRLRRDRITSVERSGSHLGKTVGRPLLKVRFLTELGSPDSVAWLVQDLPAWEAALKS